MKEIVIASFFGLLLLGAGVRTAAGDSSEIEPVKDAIEVPFPAQNDSKKITIGEIEDITLVPWSITLPARIDTGATISSLDARDVSVSNNIADFTLGRRYGGLRLRLPVVDWVQVRSSVGIEKRPVVQIGICLGPKLVRTLATLRDRSEMTYPFLVGRNVLNGSFVVDTSRSKAARPACPAGSF
jgi:hypothetical protein